MPKKETFNEKPNQCPNPKCNSTDLVRKGTKHNKNSIKELWKCNKCKKISVHPQYKGLHFRSDLFNHVIHLMKNRKMNVSKVHAHLKKTEKEKISKSTLYKWKNKYVNNT